MAKKGGRISKTHKKNISKGMKKQWDKKPKSTTANAKRLRQLKGVDAKYLEAAKKLLRGL